MSKKNSNKVQAAAAAITEVETINAAPVVEVPAGEVIEHTPTEEKPVTLKEYKPTLKEGVKMVEVTEAPAWSAELPGVTTFEGRIPDANSAGQTLYSLTVETETGITKFVNASVTQVKNYFGLASVQRGGSYKVTPRTPEDIEKLSKKETEKINSLFYSLQEMMNKYGISFAAELPEGIEESINAYYTKQEEERAARVKAAEEEKARKEEEKKRKESKKELISSLSKLDDITLQIAAAAIAGNLDEVARLRAIQKAAETVAAAC